MIGSDRFIEVFVDTPFEICEQRDTKGIYAQARRGELDNVTGIDDPYEAAEQPGLVLETVSRTAQENVQMIIQKLRETGFLTAPGQEAAATAGSTFHRRRTSLL